MSKHAMLAVIMAVTASAFGAERQVDLAKTPGETPQLYREDPGNVPIELKNAVPGQTYLVIDENDRSIAVPELGTVPTTAPACSDATGRAKFILNGKNTEAQIADAFKAIEGTSCTTAEKKNIGDAITALTTVAVGTYPLKADGVIEKSFKRQGVENPWKIVIEAQGAAPRAAAAPADRIDQQEELTDKHPSLVVMKCSYTTEKCATDEIFVNADQDSMLYITDVPRGKRIRIRATAGEYFPCKALEYNVAEYSSSTSTVIVSLHMKRNPLGLFPIRTSAIENEAASLYGLDWCPTDDRVLQKQSLFAIDESPAEFRVKAETRRAAFESARRAAGASRMGGQDSDPRLIVKEPPINALPLLLRGKSELVKVDVAFDDEQKTFVVPVRYQRFWLDAGGFFVFSRRVDEQLEYEKFSDTDTTRTVRRILKDTSVEPTTGIVVNVHPGNYPVLAFQFGIAANQSRLPSYYLGLGLRARTIGKRGLATIGTGIAMQQEDRFPNTDAGDTLPTDSPRLTASKKYGFNPYLSISLGFSFGGVSDKTDVKAAVTAD